MEKKKPTHLLKNIKELIRKENWHPTGNALQSAHSLGLTRYDIKTIVLSLEQKDFFKSMNSNYNHKIWQDVYYKDVTYNEKNFTIYVKLQITQEGTHTVVISFK